MRTQHSSVQQVKERLKMWKKKEKEEKKKIDFKTNIIF